MCLVMFLLLKHLVKMVNQKSKSYFLEKSQNFDDVDYNIKNNDENIDEEIVVDKVLEKKVVVDTDVTNLLESMPDFQVDNFLKKYKEINEKFDYDNVELIKKFIKNIKTSEKKYYDELINLKKLLDYDKIYDIYTNKITLNILRKELSKKGNMILDRYIDKYGEKLDNFIIFIDEEISKNDPYVYIQVGSKNENYDYINPLIRTVYNDKIYKGIIIEYKNKMFDYSLN